MSFVQVLFLIRDNYLLTVLVGAIMMCISYRKFVLTLFMPKVDTTWVLKNGSGFTLAYPHFYYIFNPQTLKGVASGMLKINGVPVEVGVLEIMGDIKYGKACCVRMKRGKVVCLISYEDGKAIGEIHNKFMHMCRVAAMVVIPTYTLLTVYGELLWKAITSLL